jgi:hypothetical protein
MGATCNICIDSNNYERQKEFIIKTHKITKQVPNRKRHHILKSNKNINLGK